MARTSKSDGESKTPKAAAKAPKTPARRRSDKVRQAAAANDLASAAMMVAVETVEAGGTPGNGGVRAIEVQRLAYELYVQRGCCDGHDKDDWYEAERQLRQRA